MKELWVEKYRPKTVDFKKGRCVIFPARTVHKEIKPKELTPRFSVCYLFTGLYA